MKDSHIVQLTAVVALIFSIVFSLILTAIISDNCNIGTHLKSAICISGYAVIPLSLVITICVTLSENPFKHLDKN